MRKLKLSNLLVLIRATIILILVLSVVCLRENNKELSQQISSYDDKLNEMKSELDSYEKQINDLNTIIENETN